MLYFIPKSNATIGMSAFGNGSATDRGFDWLAPRTRLKLALRSSFSSHRKGSLCVTSFT